jgi:hypothetical protein
MGKIDNKRNQRCVRFIWRLRITDYRQHLPLFTGIVQDRLNRIVIANKWMECELRILRMN